MSSLLEQVEKVLTDHDPSAGLIVAKGGKILAYRDPDLHSEHPAAWVTVLDPPATPTARAGSESERKACPGCDYVSSSAGIWHHRRRTGH